MAATPKLSRPARQAISTALKNDSIVPGEKSRVLRLAEAIARADLADESGEEPSQVKLKRLPDASVYEAIGLQEAGGLYASITGTNPNSAKGRRLRMIADAFMWVCEAASCSVQECTRDRRGRLVRKECPHPAPKQIRLQSGAKAWLGSPTKIVVETSSGVSELDARYLLVPMDAVIPSNDPTRDFDPSPGYPSHLQERDYKSPVEQEKVRRAAGETAFKPRLMISDNLDALNGPPIVDSVGRVLGGNGRTMILKQHSSWHGNGRYERALAKELSCSTCYGLSGGPIEDVIIVRQLTGEYDVNRISALLNATLTTSLSREAQSISMAQRLSDITLDMIADALGAQEKASFSAAINSLGRALVSQIQRDGLITAANQYEWLASDQGKTKLQLNRSGRQKIREAVAGALVQDVDALRNSSDSLMNFYEFIAPAALVLDRWDPENTTGYNFIPALRTVAPDLARSAGLNLADFKTRYATGELFGDFKDPNIEAVYDGGPLAPIVLCWVRNKYRKPAVATREIMRYWRSIPSEIRTGVRQGGIFSRTADEFEELDLDPDALRQSVLDMDSVDTVAAYGGNRWFLIGKKRPKRAEPTVELDEAEDELEVDVDEVDLEAARDELQEAIGAWREEQDPASLQQVRESASLLREADELDQNLRRWIMSIGIEDVDAFLDGGEYLEGGEGDDLEDEDVDDDELERGIEVEMEHTGDPSKAREIALDHLAENPTYYSDLDASGIDPHDDDEDEEEEPDLNDDELEDAIYRAAEITDEAMPRKVSKRARKVFARDYELSNELVDQMLVYVDPTLTERDRAHLAEAFDLPHVFDEAAEDEEGVYLYTAAFEPGQVEWSTQTFSDERMKRPTGEGRKYHLIGARDDEESEEALGRPLSIFDNDTEEWRRAIIDRLKALPDSAAITYNQILLDTARSGGTEKGSWGKRNADRALWDLLDEGHVEHTIIAPMRWRLVEDFEDELDEEIDAEEDDDLDELLDEPDDDADGIEGDPDEDDLDMDEDELDEPDDDADVIEGPEIEVVTDEVGTCWTDPYFEDVRICTRLGSYTIGDHVIIPITGDVGRVRKLIVDKDGDHIVWVDGGDEPIVVELSEIEHFKDEDYDCWNDPWLKNFKQCSRLDGFARNQQVVTSAGEAGRIQNLFIDDDGIHRVWVDVNGVVLRTVTKEISDINKPAIPLQKARQRAKPQPSLFEAATGEPAPGLAQSKRRAGPQLPELPQPTKTRRTDLRDLPRLGPYVEEQLVALDIGSKAELAEFLSGPRVPTKGKRSISRSSWLGRNVTKVSAKLVDRWIDQLRKDGLMEPEEEGDE